MATVVNEGLAENKHEPTPRNGQSTAHSVRGKLEADRQQFQHEQSFLEIDLKNFALHPEWYTPEKIAGIRARHGEVRKAYDQVREDLATLDEQYPDPEPGFQADEPEATREDAPPDPDWGTEEAEPSPGTAHEDVRTDFRHTDLGNGERLVARHGTNLLYCNPWKKWLAWEGTRWQLDNSQQVKKWARMTVRAIYAEASDAADKKARKALAAHAIKSEQEQRLNAMLTLAQMDVPILPEQLDADPWALNVANGTLDLRTGTRRQHQRADLITKLLPIPYDPEASCPLWEGFLERIFAGNQDLISFIWKAVGYSLTGLTIEQCFFLLYGIGSNGKSTFLDTLRCLTAEYGEQASFQTFLRQEQETIRNDLAKLRSCRFVAALEMEEGKRLAESLIKSLTGSDALTARLLFSEYFTFVPQFKIWLATNHRPEIRGTDLAIWRRVRLIPFTEVIPEHEQDKTLPAKLKEELPGILAWAVRGCLAWQQEGFAAPEAVTAATAAYREESDVLGEFLAEHCLLRPELQVPAADLYARYQEWIKASGETELSQKAFGARLRERGLRREKSNLTKRIVWHGIGLLAG